LCRTEAPDTTIGHYPPACTTCGAALTEAMVTDHVARRGLASMMISHRSRSVSL
jgi:hypothetical protein